MKKILIALSIALAGCQTTGLPVAPAPLAQSTIDEKGLIVALQTFDAMLTAVDRLIDAGVLVPGTPRALQVADAIRATKLAYEAASAAQRAGNTRDYMTAMSQVQVAIGRVNLLMKGN